MALFTWLRHLGGALRGVEKVALPLIAALVLMAPAFAAAQEQPPECTSEYCGDTNGNGVPELSAGALGGGLALLAGGTMVILGRRRRGRNPDSEPKDAPPNA